MSHISNKELRERRIQLRNAADAIVAQNSNDSSWNRNLDYGYCGIMQQIEAIDSKLATRDSIQGGPLRSMDDPMEAPSRQPTKKPEGAKGRQVSDSTYLFQRGESVAATLTQSDISLGDVVRATILGDRASLGHDENGGGYTVSTQVAAGVLDLARSKSVLSRAGMQMATMTSSELRMPRLLADPVFEIKAENQAFDEDTTMEFGALVFHPVLIGTFITMSRELAEDSSNFERIVEEALANSFAVTMDRFPLLGASGGGTRVGLLDDPAIGETGSTGSLTWAKIAAEATTIRGLNHEPGTVLLHPAKRDVVLDTTATGSGEWLGPPPSLANVQVLDSTSITSTKGLVGDFTKLILAVRSGPIIESTQVGGDSFKKHQLHLKLAWRADFGLTHPAAFRRLAGIS